MAWDSTSGNRRAAEWHIGVESAPSSPPRMGSGYTATGLQVTQKLLCQHLCVYIRCSRLACNSRTSELECVGCLGGAMGGRSY